MKNKKAIEFLKLKNFETDLRNHGVGFSFLDDDYLSAALILSGGDLRKIYEQYAIELYNLCTDNDYLKNDRVIRKILEGVEAIKAGKKEMLRYNYHGEKPFEKIIETDEYHCWCCDNTEDISYYFFKLFGCACYWVTIFYHSKDKKIFISSCTLFYERQTAERVGSGIFILFADEN